MDAYSVLRSLPFASALALGLSCRHFQNNSLWSQNITHIPDSLHESLTSERLRLFPKLEVLYVTSDKTLFDEDLIRLTHLRELHLCPMRTAITGKGLRALPALRSLHLGEWNTKLTNADLAALTQLTCLTIEGTRGLDTSAFLPSLKSLTELHLIGVGCNGIDSLLPNLETLVVALNERGTKVKGLSEAQLSRCSALRSLSLELNPIDPACLANLTHLEELYYNPTANGPAPTQDFFENIKNLRRFNGAALSRKV